MDVEMRHGLAGGASDIDPNVVTIRGMSSVEVLADSVDERCESGLFVGSGLKPRVDMAARDQQGMSRRYREGVQ
jgi:hypothetical protein